MDVKMPLVTYVLAAMSGVCFIGGFYILSKEGELTRVQT